MDTKEIEAIVKDTVNFVDEEFFETTKGEKSDLAAFLRERLAQAPAQPAPGGSVTFREIELQGYRVFRCDNPAVQSGEYYPAAQVAELVAAAKKVANGYSAEHTLDMSIQNEVDALTAALARFEGGAK